VAERILRVVIEGSAESVKRAFKETESSSQSLGSKFASLGKGAALLAGGAALGAVTVGLEKVLDAASKEQAAQAKLDAAFKASGLNAKSYSKEIDGAESSGRKLGFTNTDVMGSLAKLIIPTHDTGLAMKDMAIAEDLARFKHIDLSSASQMLAQAMTGSQRAVKQLGITIPPVTASVDALKRAHVDTTTSAGALMLAHAKLQDKLATGNAIIDAVTQKVKGQAQAYADTAAGGMAQFTAQLDNIEAKIGQKLLPIFQALLAWVNQHWPEISSAIDTAMKIAEKAIDAVKPFIELLVTTIGNMVKVVDALIHGRWSQAWDALKSQVDAVIHYVTGLINTLVSVLSGPLSAAWNAMKTVAAAALGALKTAYDNSFKPAWDGIQKGLEWIRDNAQKAWDALKNAILTVWKYIGPVLSAIGAAIGAVVGAAEKLIGLLEKITSLGSSGGPNVGPAKPAAPGSSAPVPGNKIPAAAGGPVMPGLAYLVGERGPELLMPSSAGTVVPNRALGGGATVAVHLHAPYVGDKRQFADQLAEEIYSALRRLNTAGMPALS
jgi:hypothetical protein